VIISQKRCKIETWLQWKTNRIRNSYVDCQMAPFPMTLNDLEIHFCCLKPFCNSHTWEMSHLLSTMYVYGWIWKRMWLVTWTIFSTLKDISRSHAITYNVNVIVSWKWCKMESLLLQTINRKWYIAYQIAAIRITLTDFPPTASLFKCDCSYSCAAVDKISTEIIIIIKNVLI